MFRLHIWSNIRQQRLVLSRRTYWPDRMTIVAIAAVHVVNVLSVRTEVECPRVVRTFRSERTRPIDTAAACVAETAIVAVTCSGQEETVAV